MKISKHPDVQGVVSIDSDAGGPRVVLFGGVHGDEVSGVHAVENLGERFEGILVDLKGAPAR